MKPENKAQLFDLHQTPVKGINLIEANAGTGKTYTLVGLFLRLLFEKDIKAENILVVTYTEAAAAELRDRIGAKMRAALDGFQQGAAKDDFISHLLSRSSNHRRDYERIKLALLSFDEAPILTIHGFCLKMLTDFAFESLAAFEPELITDQSDLIHELAADYWRTRLYLSNEDFTAFFLAYYPSPESLTALLRQTISRPVQYMLPRPGASAAPQDLYRNIERLFHDLQASWQNNGDAIIALLHCQRHWHKKYGEALQESLQQVELFFAVGRPLANAACLNPFTPDVIGRNTKKVGTPPTHPIFEAFASYTSLVHRLQYAMPLDFIKYASKELQLRKQKKNLRSFDDLLHDLHKILAGSKGRALAEKIRRKFGAALIDEFQDTDPIQYSIFKTVFAKNGTPLFYIGDPKQSIYNFRGADIYAYLDAEEDVDYKYTLQVNYRSDKDLVSAINAIFNFRHDPFVETRIKFSNSSGAPKNPERSLAVDGKILPPVQFWFRAGQDRNDSIGSARLQITEATASHITELLNLGAAGRAVLHSDNKAKAIQPEDIAVLVRTHREAAMLQEALRQRNVPSVLKVNRSVFDTDDFLALKYIAEAIADYRNEAKIKCALITDIMGLGGTELYQLMQNERCWEELLDNFRDYHRIWSAAGFHAAMRELLQRQKIREKLLAKHNGPRSLTNLLHLMELFHQVETDFNFSISGLLHWAEKIQPNSSALEANLIRLETDAAAVKIVTVHSSKGLEFPIVYIPFSWASKTGSACFFHDPANKFGLTLDLAGQPDNKQIARREELAEDLRLFYVALTRAKHSCFVAWGNIPGTNHSCYRYLFHRNEPKSEPDMWSDLQRLEDGARGTVSLKPLPAPRKNSYTPAPSPAAAPVCLHFKGSLHQDWSISSFTSVALKRKDDLEGLDHADHPGLHETSPEEEITPGTDGNSILSFPAGVRTGNCFHEIFEHLDFALLEKETTAAVVQQKLQKFDFAPDWAAAVLQLAYNVAARLLPSVFTSRPFSLAEIAPGQTVREMGFHFPIAEVRSRVLASELAGHVSSAGHKALLASLAQLEFKTLHGYMKGFIDLIFSHEGRFYILDWKTNKLGNRPDDYTEPHLHRAMQANLYHLQYYIYAVALHRYLRSRLGENYGFEKHFGGVYYVFVRGIDPQRNDTGIYYDSLHGSGNILEILEKVFCGDTR